MGLVMTGPSSAAATTPVLGASPATYTNTTSGIQEVSIVGGTVSIITQTRAGVPQTLSPQTTTVLLGPGDSITITYTVAPTLVATQII